MKKHAFLTNFLMEKLFYPYLENSALTTTLLSTSINNVLKGLKCTNLLALLKIFPNVNI